MTGPYESLREYADAMAAEGQLLRIPEMDQDRYEMTAFGYRLEDRRKAAAPMFLVERTQINGRWYETPVVGGVLNSYRTVAQAFGVADVSDDEGRNYQLAVDHIMGFLGPDYRWPVAEPVTVGREDAPCKEVVLEGDEVDLYQFPWIKNNPADAGQYISTGAVITEDPELGRNVGTHRMMVKNPRHVGLDLSTQSHAFSQVQRAAKKGEKFVPVAVAIGIDPISWMMSSTRLAGAGEDEFAIAGGFRGRPVELVKCDSNALHVPTTAEIVLEGVIPVKKEWEGPYGEMLGYIGEAKFTYSIDVHRITHREQPWVYNVWPGIGGAYLTLPWEVGPFARLKQLCPSLLRLHTPPQIPALAVACIDKRLPGEGIETGMLIMGYRMTGFHKKMVIVVDRDVDPTDLTQVMRAVATRWQPDPASVKIKQSFHFLLDPSTQRNFLSSKMIIDATRQLPAEGGPEEFPLDNRTVMEERQPEAFELVDKKWADYFRT